MNKIIEIPYLTKKNEPSITLVRPNYREKYAETKFGSEVYHDLEDFEGKKDKTYILVVSVSPKKYWGQNKNHDGFSEYWLKKKHHTFCTNGTFYKNHVNKDPKKNYGDNEASWYDDEMKRVLVLIGVDNNKAPDIVEDVENGKKIGISMGCRIPYDVCYICGNKAETRDQYCDHMKLQAGKLLEDGRQVGVDNPDPTFFDLSKVVRPAGHIEYMIKHVVPKKMKKEKAAEIWIPKRLENMIEKAASEQEPTSAELYEKEADLEDKLARLKKLCDIEKIIEGESVVDEDVSPKMKAIISKTKDIKHISNLEDIDDDTIKKLSDHPLCKIMPTANMMGIRLKAPEISKLIIIKIRNKSPDVDELEHNLKKTDYKDEDVLKERSPSEYLLKKPNVFKMLIDSGIFDDLPENISEEIIDLLKGSFTKRAIYPAIVEKRAYLGGALDPVGALDASGSEYLTTNEAIDRARELQAGKTLLKGLGLGGALGAASYAATKLPIIGGKYMIPAAVLGTLFGAKELNDYFKDPELATIPSETVLQKMSSLIDEEDLLAFEKIAQDPQELLYSAIPNYQGDTWWDWVKSHPEMSILSGLVGAGAATKGLGAMLSPLSRAASKFKGKYFPSPVGQAVSGAKQTLTSQGKITGSVTEGVRKSNIQTQIKSLINQGYSQADAFKIVSKRYP
ncbi:MAG: hypothetical protein ACTSPI_00125 [Candidatus Heimdallarchaeaceae archaeon]